MKYYFLEVRTLDDAIHGLIARTWEYEGPPATPMPLDGHYIVPVPERVSMAAPTPTAQAYWRGDVLVWVEEQPLLQAIAAAVAKCYTDIDAIYDAAIGKRQAEYTDAETDARAFVADGAAATENITGFARANPTGAAQTNLWAAEQIIARADAFRAAQVAMRTQRFDSQAAMRACSTPADLAHVIYLWDQFITGLREQLGLQ